MRAYISYPDTGNNQLPLIEEVEPNNGTDFELEELQKIVGGYIETVPSLSGNHIIVLNEEGKLKGLPKNMHATLVFNHDDGSDYICGTVLICLPEMVR